MELGNRIDLNQYLFNSNSVILFSVDIAGNVRYSNLGYKNILKYTENNIKDRFVNPPFDFFACSISEPQLFNGIITLRKNQKDTSSFIAQVIADGHEIVFLCEYDASEIESLYKEMAANSLKINNMNRELIKKEVLLNNAINELRETQSMLIHSEKMNALGQLVAGIAHEINNPMAYVIGNIELLENYVHSVTQFVNEIENKFTDQLDPYKTKYDLEYILSDLPALQSSTLEGAERVKKIVMELRDFSRIDSLELSCCNIRDCINSVIRIANPQIKQKSIKILINLLETSDIECYPAQLNQALLNIIINSIQAVSENGEITVKLYEQDRYIRVEIIDNGSGIPDGNKGRIFEPFFTTKPPGKGVGLGLNLSYKIIKDLHKGEIDFESTFGEGTRFIISIPKA